MQTSTLSSVDLGRYVVVTVRHDESVIVVGLAVEVQIMFLNSGTVEDSSVALSSLLQYWYG